MVIGIIGESCTGKSTLAEKLKEHFGGAKKLTQSIAEHEQTQFNT